MKKNYFFFRRSFVGFLCFIFVLISINLKTPIIFAEDYPASTNKGTDIKITKDSKWVGVNGEAEVKVTFNGKQDSGFRVKPVDLVFVLDTSSSMGTETGCINKTHKTYDMHINYTVPSFGPQQITMDQLVDEAIASGKIVVEGGDGHILGKKVTIDKNLKIPIPETVLNKPNLFLVPVSSDFTSSNSNRLYFDHMNSPLWYTWGIIDESKPISIDTTSGKSPRLFYHCDEQGNRICHEGSMDGTNNHYIPFLDSIIGYNTYKKDGVDIIYDANGVPNAWKKPNGCLTRAHLLNDSVTAISNKILDAGDKNRVAFAAFGTNARGKDISDQAVRSQGYSNFVNDKAVFASRLKEVVQYTGEKKTVKIAAASGTTNTESYYTNYSAGMLSGHRIIADDASVNNGNKKMVVFVSDGMPNHFQEPYTITDDGGTYFARRLATTNLNLVTQPKKVTDYMKTNYDATVHGIALDDKDSVLVRDKVGQIINGDIYNVDATNPTAINKAFDKIFDSLKEPYSLKTNITKISDVIDSRYFTIDEDLLSANVGNKYYPEYASYQINNVVKDGINCKEIVFTYDTSSTELKLDESVIIPLNKIPEATIENTQGYIPTNFDPIGTGGGAKGEYVDLAGENKILESGKTWLPTGDLAVEKIDGLTRSKLAGAEFSLYYENNDQRYGTLTYTSDANGLLSINTLPPGRYYLKETKAPTGYELDSLIKAVFEIDFLAAGNNHIALEIENTRSQDPVDPNNPTDPSNPIEPSDPSDPLKPITPTPLNGKNSSTGDKNDLIVISLLITSCLAIVIVGRKKFLNKNK